MSSRVFNEGIDFPDADVEYLEEELRRLRVAGIERLVLCIDEQRCCTNSALPAGARIVPYRTRIEQKKVLAAIEQGHELAHAITTGAAHTIGFEGVLPRSLSNGVSSSPF